MLKNHNIYLFSCIHSDYDNNNIVKNANVVLDTRNPAKTWLRTEKRLENSKF